MATLYEQKYDPVLIRFLAYFRLDVNLPPDRLLRQVIAAFARLPYENLTKIIKGATADRVEEARRLPGEVVGDHITLGAGGTCFALTSTLLYLLRSLGWLVEPILADRPYGPDTHSALLIWLDGRPHLIDPGYLLIEPIPLPQGQLRIPTSFHEVLLTPVAGANQVDLATVNQGKATQRIRFKTEPVDWGDFLKVWDNSFGADLLRYPVLSQVAAGQHLYLQGNRLQTRSKAALHRIEIAPAELANQIATTFGVDVNLAHQALQILTRKGETLGRPPVA